MTPVYASDPFSHDFATVLGDSLERATAVRRRKESEQEAADELYEQLFVENYFHPGSHGVTYGLGYPTPWEDEALELTAGKRATHRRRAAQQGLVRRAIPPARRVGSQRGARPSSEDDSTCTESSLR